MSPTNESHGSLRANPRVRLVAVAWLCGALVSPACVRGASGAAAPGAGPVLVTAAPEPAGGSCLAGGIKLGTGRDGDGNGVLERFEVTRVSYVCNDGVTLVDAATERPGERCALGGVRLERGRDVDGDRTVDAAEVTRTSYVCNR